MTEIIERKKPVAEPTPEDESARLKKLVAELVEKNQALRFEVAALKRKERALAEASAVYGLLLP